MGKRGVKPRTSPEQEVAAAKLFEHLGPTKAAEVMGMPTSTLVDLAARVEREQASVIARARRYTREYHQSLLQDRLLGCLENSDPATKPKETFQLSYAHRNFFESLNLLLGQPTEIHAHLIDQRVEILGFAERLARMLPAGTERALPPLDVGFEVKADGLGADGDEEKGN